ncbi:S1 family peptidase [Nocardia noduli]|uniref:S1 family peptidase n=1 Tax=Nocardia noduli TaxID=2815722 RepID=UPI001C2188D2|nr:serine protease [Nocardia noduli]
MEIPPVEQFAAGPRRAVLESLHELYRAADGPGIRTISEGIAAGDYRATMNRDLVAKILSGTRWPTAWQLDSLVRWLAVRAVDDRTPETEAQRFQGLHERAAAARDTTSRLVSDPNGSAVQVVSNPGRTRYQVGMGVLLSSNAVLTHAFVLEAPRLTAQGKMAYKVPEAVEVIPVSGRYRARYPGQLDWWDDSDQHGLAVLKLEKPIPEVSRIQWTTPSPDARVRVFGIADDGTGIWAQGTVTGQHGDIWQLDLHNAPPLQGGNAGAYQGFAGAAVLDSSGRAVGIMTSVWARGTRTYFMTSANSIASKVPSFRW